LKVDDLAAPNCTVGNQLRNPDDRAADLVVVRRACQDCELIDESEVGVERSRTAGNFPGAQKRIAW